MALTSFTLRKTVTAGGSGNRRFLDDQSNSATDNSLKSDGFVTTPPEGAGESTFSAEVYERGQIELSWALEDALVESATSADFDVTEIVIRASADGEPITTKDGILVASITTTNIAEYVNQDNEYLYIDKNPIYVQNGNWVYYSLFARYENNTNDAFYERVTTLSVQIPQDWGSTQALWERIPVYYKELDDKLLKELQAQDVSYPYQEGPLYRYVSLFGWELDKIRTTIFDTMRINDPSIIHSSAIDALAYQVGAEINKDALGTIKLRNLLNNIGYLRRTKGTATSVQAYVAALSGSFVSTITSGASTSFNVHPHRVNLFSDPEFANTTGAKEFFSGTYPTMSQHGTWTSVNAGVNGAYGWGIYAITTNISSVSASAINGELTIQCTNPAEIAVYSRTAFRYNPNLVYYGSAVSTASFSIGFINWSDIQAIEAGSASTTAKPKTISNKESEPLLSVSNRKLVKYDVDPGTSASAVVPCFLFSVPSNTTITLKEPLIEYNNSSADYFTGDSVQGAFIEDATGSTLGVYDYYWGESGSGSPNNDFSFYTLDSKRVRQVIQNVITEYVMPVNQTLNVNYFINWDVIQ